MSNLRITTTTLPSGHPGTLYSVQLEAFGGWTPYTWSLSGGSLPPGFTISSDGIVSGTPTADGTFSFTASVTDSQPSTPTTLQGNFVISVASTTTPGLNDVFNPYYDLYSISRYDFVIPDHFDIYVPDQLNETDFQCLSVISPSPTKNAKQWTYNGRWLTIGVYRDEGRDPAIRPSSTEIIWARSGMLVTMVDIAGHKLRTGDSVNVYNINVPQLMSQKVTVVDTVTFTVSVPDEGAVSGVNGAYQPSVPYNFFEENYVFRILPSFALVPWSLIQKLFDSTAPNPAPQQRELMNVTTGLTTQIPKGINKSTNYNLPTTGQTTQDTAGRRFNQVYDENGDPLRVSYRQDGQAVTTRNYDSPNYSKNKKFNAPIMNEAVAFGDAYRITAEFDPRITDSGDLRLLNLPHDDSLSDTRVYVYDFYGGEINDPYRGPYFTTDLITRDTSKPAPYDNILRAGQNAVPYYGKKLYDIFNNLVIGIQENNATVIRQNLLPLALDRFSRPIKFPLDTPNSGKWKPTPTPDVVVVLPPQPPSPPAPAVHAPIYFSPPEPTPIPPIPVPPMETEFVSSAIYPFLVSESVDISPLAVTKAQELSAIIESLSVGQIGITAGTLAETLIFVSYTNAAMENVAVSPVHITAGALADTLIFVVLNNQSMENVAVSPVQITAGSLIDTLIYIVYNNAVMENVAVSPVTIVNGSLV